MCVCLFVCLKGDLEYKSQFHFNAQIYKLSWFSFFCPVRKLPQPRPYLVCKIKIQRKKKKEKKKTLGRGRQKLIFKKSIRNPIWLIKLLFSYGKKKKKKTVCRKCSLKMWIHPVRGHLCLEKFCLWHCSSAAKNQGALCRVRGPHPSHRMGVS